MILENVKLRPSAANFKTKRRTDAMVKALMPPLGAFGAGFLLAGARFMEAPLPAAVCLIAGLGTGFPALWAFLGTVVGSLLLWQTDGALLAPAAGFLTLTVQWALQDFSFSRKRFFPHAATLASGALAGGLLLLSDPVTLPRMLFFLLQLLFLPFGTEAAKQILDGKKGPALCLGLFALVSGTAGILFADALSLGAVIACASVLALAGTALSYPAAIVSGLALDWGVPSGLSCTGVLAAAAFCMGLLPKNRSRWRYPVFLLSVGISILLTGGEEGVFFLAAVLGGAVLLFPPNTQGLSHGQITNNRLHTAGNVLEEVYRVLGDLPLRVPAKAGKSPEETYLRRQLEHQRRELRTVLAVQYRILADFLHNCAESSEAPGNDVFSVSAACRQKKRGNAALSGDRALCFRRGNFCYLLLCDGMGTGEEAAEDSRRAVELLRDLITAGMSADDALETLNATAILREEGGFSTVDLAEVSLLDGEGVLYKWGAAPSYLVSKKSVKRVGTATLPPGVGVGGTHQAQRVRLSLGRGEVLILTTDGIDGEEVETVLRQGEFSSPEELAAKIVMAGCRQTEDDATAAVLKLRSSSVR